MMLLHTYIDSFEDKLVESFILLTNSYSKIVDQGMVKDLFLSCRILFFTFCQHRQDISGVFTTEKIILKLEVSIVSKNFLENRKIVFLFLDGFSFEGNLSTCHNLFLAFVNNHVGIFNLFFDIVYSSLSSKSFLCKVSYVKISHDRIIKFIPFVGQSILNKGIVMSTISMAHMYDDALQDIVVIVRSKLLLLINRL